MPKVLVTGVAGLLGSHLADFLVKEGHEVVGIDNFSGGYVDNVPNAIEFHQGDTSDLELVRNILSRGVEVVYHAACTAYEGLSVFSPKVITDNTFGNSVSVFSAAISEGCRRVVFCSSMARYGEQEITPFTEEMTPLPQDPYGISKLAAERVLVELANTHKIEFSIAVPHNIIGPRQKYDDPFRNVVSIMINLMLQKRQPIIYGDGEQLRCFSFIDDVVEPLANMGFESKASGEVINLGPDFGAVTINELASIVAKLLNFDLDPVYLPNRPREVKVATCSAEKARRILNFESKKSLVDGISELISYIEKRGPREFQYHLPIEIVSDLTPISWTKKMF